MYTHTVTHAEVHTHSYACTFTHRFVRVRFTWTSPAVQATLPGVTRTLRDNPCYPGSEGREQVQCVEEGRLEQRTRGHYDTGATSFYLLSQSNLSSIPVFFENDGGLD